MAREGGTGDVRAWHLMCDGSRMYPAVGKEFASYSFVDHAAGEYVREAICKAWVDEPDRFRLDPVHLTSGLNT